MLLVYNPTARVHVAHEGGGIINRNIPREGHLSDFYPVAMWLLSYGIYLATDDVN